LAALEADSPKPNIVFIMADDLGAGWVDYDDSNPEINTPNLQRLVETGMVFNRAYATGFIGKWHLAGTGLISSPGGVVNADWHPDQYGFDSNIGGCAMGQSSNSAS